MCLKERECAREREIEKESVYICVRLGLCVCVKMLLKDIFSQDILFCVCACVYVCSAYVCVCTARCFVPEDLPMAALTVARSTQNKRLCTVSGPCTTHDF